MANLRVDNLCGNGFVSANDGTVWSNYVTSTTGSTLTNYPATYGFDGNIANFVYADNNSTMTWTPPNGGIKAERIEVYVYAGNTHPPVTVNGVSTGGVVGSATPNQLGNWVDVTSLVGGHLKTIQAYGYPISSTERSSGWAAVRINGEILTDGLVGTKGGRNAIDGSVYFSNDAVDYLTVGANGLPSATDHFNFLHNGTSDFNAEFWIKPGKDNDRQTVFSTGGNSSTTGFACRIMEDGAAGGSNGYKVFVQFSRGSSGNWLGFLGGILTVGEWAHVALTFTTSNKQLAIYVNGVLTNSSDLDGTANGTFGSGDFATGNSTYPMEIGREPYNTNMYLDGATVSNFRICQHVIYTAAFTPPTTKLELHNGTALLCCQDTNNPTQEASGKEMLGFGGVYQGKRYSNIATNGDLETGDTTGWTNGGCSTFEVSTNVVHSGTYSLHCVSDGNGDYVYTTASVKSDLRYKVSAYINCVGPAGTSAKAKMKLDHSSAGASQLYESQTVDAGSGWRYVEWIGIAQSSTMYITFNESSANNVNDWYVDDLKVELWYPEEGENILPNPGFLTGATGWSFSSTPSGEYTISSNRLNVADTSRTNDAYATVQLFAPAMKEGKYKVTIDYVLTSDDFDIGIGNNRVFGVAGGGTFSGAGNSASVTYEIEAGNGNSSLRLIANQHCVGYFNNITLSRVAEPKRINDLPPVGIDAGVVFDGDIKINSPGVMYFPTGDTSQRGRGRGAFAMTASYPNTSNSISYIDIASQGTAKDFGDLTAAGRYGCGNSSATRGVSGSAVGRYATMDYFTLATTGNALSFGTLTYNNYAQASVANSTRIVWISGYSPSPVNGNINVMTYITTATKGNGTDFGDYSDGEKARYLGGNISSPTRGLAFGGYHDPNYTTNIDYINIATTSDSLDFGDLSGINSGCPGCSDSTRGVIFGGYTGQSPEVTTNRIDMVTIATTGTATDFGDIPTARKYGAACSNSIRGVHCAGGYPAADNSMSYVTIQTTGNAQDFGDLPTGETGGDSCENNNFSDSHGGLS